jgi:hypothetical protein
MGVQRGAAPREEPMLRRAVRLTENLAVLSLLAASSIAMRVAARRDQRRRDGMSSAWPAGAAVG